MQIRSGTGIGSARNLDEFAPVEIADLVALLSSINHDPMVVRYDSDLNQLLQATVGTLRVQIVAGRGHWFVTLESPTSGGDFTVAIWRACSDGGAAIEGGGSTFSRDDLTWLKCAIESGSHISVDASKLRDMQIRTVST